MILGKYKKILYFILLILVFILGFISSRLISNSLNFIECKSNYKFINPQPGCEFSEEENSKDIMISSNKIQNFIDQSIETNKASNVSVFFRDLVSRRWFGINENENYIPGSLLKLPLMIAYFKISELNKSIFYDRLKYEGSNGDRKHEDIIDGTPLKRGEFYTTEELIKKMIIYSDNDSSEILFKKLSESLIDKVFVDLGVFIQTKDGIVRDYISAKTYGSIFRPLYNASYLNREMSERALEILSQSSFKDGLAAGVPSNIVVAHKFGDNYQEIQNGLISWQTMHDCGIIYVPNHPYILCVTSKGNNIKDLENIIKTISQMVYKEISS